MQDDDFVPIVFDAEETTTPEQIEQDQTLDTIVRQYVKMIARRDTARAELKEAKAAVLRIEQNMSQLRCKLHKHLHTHAKQAKRK